MVDDGVLPATVDGVPVGADTALDAALPRSLERFVLVVWAEERCDETFPADLLDTLATVGDFVHYFLIKSARNESRRAWS